MTFVVYGRTEPSCSFCEKTKNLLNVKKQNYTFIDINERERLLEIANRYGVKTIPIIVKDGELLGGYAELEKYICEHGL